MFGVIKVIKVDKKKINILDLYKLRYLICMALITSMTFTTSSYEKSFLKNLKIVRVYHKRIIGNEIKEISNTDKITEILQNYNLTKEQFDVIVAVVLGEAAANSYDDAYAVINTIYNRTQSQTWINYVNQVMNCENGNNLYYQVICPSQFSVYIDNLYLDYMNKTDLPGYQAVIDFLYNKEIKHNYLSFVSCNDSMKDKVQFVENGNLYYNELIDEDRLSNSISLQRTKAN